MPEEKIKISPSLKLYLNTSPFWVNSDKESDLEFSKKIYKFDELPENVKAVMANTETADLIRELVIQKAGLTIEEAKILAMIIRKICFGEISLNLLKAAIIKFLKLDEEIAKNFANILFDKLFSDAVIQLQKIEEKEKIRKEEEAIKEKEEAGKKFVEVPAEAPKVEKIFVPPPFPPSPPPPKISFPAETAAIPSAQLPERGSEEIPHEYEYQIPYETEIEPPSKLIDLETEKEYESEYESEKAAQRIETEIEAEEISPPPPSPLKPKFSYIRRPAPREAVIEESKQTIPVLTPEQIAAGIFPKIGAPKRSDVVDLKRQPKKPPIPPSNIIDLKN